MPLAAPAAQPPPSARDGATMPASVPVIRWNAFRAFGVSPSEKRTLDLITEHPMIPREHLALWLGVSEERVSQMMDSLADTWGLVERRGKRGYTRSTLSAERIGYVTHRDRAEFPTTQGIWCTAFTTDKQGRRRRLVNQGRGRASTRCTGGSPSRG